VKHKKANLVVLGGKNFFYEGEQALHFGNVDIKSTTKNWESHESLKNRAIFFLKNCQFKVKKIVAWNLEINFSNGNITSAQQM